MNSCVIIPARYKSTRFPGKPLAKILNKEMILHVADACSIAVGKKNVYIATDDSRIKKKCNQYGYITIMTDKKCKTGTDRIASLVEKLNYEVIINVQGDEPLVDPNDILKCIKLKKIYTDHVINGYSKIQSEKEFLSNDIPKVVFNRYNNLIYISRAPIPSSKEKKIHIKNKYKQVCIYGYSKKELIMIKENNLKSYVEEDEDIEILRFIENGYAIKMFECNKDSIAVDRPEDIVKVELRLK